MTPSSANPSELIAAAKLLLSEMLEEGIDHVETLPVAEAEPAAAEPARTSPGQSRYCNHFVVEGGIPRILLHAFGYPCMEAPSARVPRPAPRGRCTCSPECS